MSRKTIDENTLEILQRSKVSGNVLSLPETLSRQTYVAVDRVLKGLGGKWSKKDGGHLFPFCPSELFAETLDRGEYVNRQQAMQQFMTPPMLASEMAAAADIEVPVHGVRTRVLEPSAGLGSLVDAALRYGGEVEAVEIDPTMAQELSRRFDHAVSDRVLTVHTGNFLFWASANPEPRYDVVLMNPPFQGNQDIDHILAAHALLKPGGRLLAICSPHAMFGRESKASMFREWLEHHSARVSTIAAGTFKSSGTMVETRLIRMTLAPPARRPVSRSALAELPLFAGVDA